MEARCHLGHECVYVLSADGSNKTDIRFHRIGVVIKSLIARVDVPLPDCVPAHERAPCDDCTTWDFV